MIPFPDRSPPGRPATAAGPGREGQPRLYFSTVDGQPLFWGPRGPEGVATDTDSPANFGEIRVGDVLVGPSSGWVVRGVCKTPCFTRNTRPRWDVVVEQQGFGSGDAVAR